MTSLTFHPTSWSPVLLLNLHLENPSTNPSAASCPLDLQRDTNTQLGQGGERRCRHLNPTILLNRIGKRNPATCCLSAPYPTNSPQLSKLDTFDRPRSGDMSKLSCIWRGCWPGQSIRTELQIIDLPFISLVGSLTRLIHQVRNLFYIIA